MIPNQGLQIMFRPSTKALNSSQSVLISTEGQVQIWLHYELLYINTSNLFMLLTWASFTRQPFRRSAEVTSARFQVYTIPAAVKASSLHELQLSIEQINTEVQQLRAKRPHPSVITCEHPRVSGTAELGILRSCFSDLH